MRMRVYLRGIPSSVIYRLNGSGERLSFSSFSDAISDSVYLLLPSLVNQETFHFLLVESSELDDAVANCPLYIYRPPTHASCIL